MYVANEKPSSEHIHSVCQHLKLWIWYKFRQTKLAPVRRLPTKDEQLG